MDSHEANSNKPRPDESASRFRKRFPAVGSIEIPERRRRIRAIQQSDTSDCGAACLAMVLHYFGREVSLGQLRDDLGGGRDGLSALRIMDTARQHGLQGRAVRLEPEDLDYLPKGAILHWRMSHFVVLERRLRNGVEVVDPATGRRKLSMLEFNKAFTGVALVFEPTSSFQKLKKGRSRVLFQLRNLLFSSGMLTKILVSSVLIQVFALALPLITGAMVDRVIPRGDLGLLTVIAAGIGMLTVFSFVASFLRAHLLLHLEANLDLRMTLNFVDHLMRLPFSFFQLRQTGDLIMRLNSNVQIREVLTSSTISALLDGFLVMTYLIVLFVTHWGLGLIVLGLGLLRVGVYMATRQKVRDLMSENLQALAESSNYQVQMLEGVETIKSSGAEARAVQHWSSLFVAVANVGLQRGRLNAVIQSSLHALATLSPLLLLGYGGKLVIDGALSLGTMLAMNALAAGFLVPLSSLVTTALRLQTVSSYADRVDDVLAKEPEQGLERGRQAPILLGGVEVRNLHYRYAESMPWAVEAVDVTIERGQRVAVVGHSGSGKSTLARVLVGLYPAVSGKILYDGMDLSGCDVDSLRRQIGFVPQFPFLFATSIRDNISLSAPDAPLEIVENAARMACIHDEIMSMPLNYETPISAGGASLAGGECQRIAIARAFLKRPPLLVLDEATSHLDAISERKIHENLRSLRCTQIIIAHRLSTVVDAELILVMDSGRIVERGTHSELLELGGVYATLFENQLKGIRHPRVDS